MSSVGQREIITQQRVFARNLIADGGCFLRACLMQGIRMACLVFPPGLLWTLGWPAAAICVLRERRATRRLADEWTRLPLSWRQSCPDHPKALFRHRVRLHMARILCFVPDRLASDRWRPRCRWEGMEHLRGALAAKQPVILVFAHFGPLLIARYWFRSVGIPVATLIGGSTSGRSWFQKRKDSLAPLPETPNVFSLGELQGAGRFLKRGGVLMMAVDMPASRAVQLEMGEARIQSASGAFHLAGMTGALLVPLAISAGNVFRYEIGLGPPIELSEAPQDSRPAVALTEIWEFFGAAVARTPAQSGTSLLDCCTPTSREDRIPA